LAPVEDNPGQLSGRFYVPASLQGGAPLVVVLHGCTQTAAGYDEGSGWSRLADRHGFALLFPEQQRANNPNLCFNWFQTGDTSRGSGEAASIRAMIVAMVERHDIDPRRVFVTGLSAGGAMAAAMLATYPEVFAGGAIIAGVAYGCASNVPEAFECMAGRGDRGDAAELGERVRTASPHKGPWPRISVWHGSADQTVAPGNSEAIVSQWANVHGLSANPTLTDRVDDHPRQVWRGVDGAVVIEHYLVTGMAHGTPLKPGTDEGESGATGAHMLDAGISSTDRIAHFFGIAGPGAGVAGVRPAELKSEGTSQSQAVAAPRKSAPWPATKAVAATGVQKVIEDALKAAGLMR